MTANNLFQLSSFHPALILLHLSVADQLLTHQFILLEYKLELGFPRFSSYL